MPMMSFFSDRPLSERKILPFLFSSFLYYRSVATRESRGRRDAVRLVEASFTANKIRKNRENLILVNIMMPVFAERIVHPMTLAENVYQKDQKANHI